MTSPEQGRHTEETGRPATPQSARFFSVNPVLDVYLDEFEAGLRALQQQTDDPSRDLVARRLCQLSREIRFRLGPPTEAPQDTVERTLQLFADASEQIGSNLLGDSGRSETWRKNIEERAKELRRVWLRQPTT